MSVSPKKKSATAKARVAPSTKVVGGPPSLAKMEAAASKLPGMIRPKYLQFPTPNEPVVIIQKIMIGKRDEINSIATDSNGQVDAAIVCQAAVFESLVYPVLTFEQVLTIDPEDFGIVWEKVNDLSYRKVGEVVSQFLESGRVS